MNTASLNAQLKEEIYIDLLPSLSFLSHVDSDPEPSSTLIQESNSSDQPIVGRLHKALYEH